MAPAQSGPQRALFCTITQEPGHGGIARVSSVLWQAMQALHTPSWELLVATTPGTDALTFMDKLRFSLCVILQQVRGDCDFIFFDHLGLARVQGLVPRLFRRPYGVFLHSIEAWTPLTRSRLRTLVNASLRVSNSHYTATRVAAAHPGVGEIEVCQLTLGLNMLDAGPKVREQVDDLPVLSQIHRDSVLVVGRMMQSERHKGHDQLISAWPLVMKIVPDAQLVIVGEGDDVGRLKALAQRLNVGQSVFFTGRVNDRTLNAIYGKSAIFAMPSRAEGFGMVYLEAMFHRLPCIGSIHDAAREVIIDGETGFLVDQDDTNDLALKIGRLLTDPALRCRFGRKGFERLERSFSFQRFENRISELLSKLSV